MSKFRDWYSLKTRHTNIDSPLRGTIPLSKVSIRSAGRIEQLPFCTHYLFCTHFVNISTDCFSILHSKDFSSAMLIWWALLTSGVNSNLIFLYIPHSEKEKWLGGARWESFKISLRDFEGYPCLISIIQ